MTFKEIKRCIAGIIMFYAWGICFTDSEDVSLWFMTVIFVLAVPAWLVLGDWYEEAKEEKLKQLIKKIHESKDGVK